LAKAFPTKKGREAFMKTHEYSEIKQLLSDVRRRTGLVEGATPKRKSGRFVVRLPQSLLVALEREAKAEGVSLNQLVVAKLAIQLGDFARK
jgi:predicted HicB family RNase H-like nuclease